MTGEVMVTLSEAAAKLGLTHATLARQARLGRLDAVKMGPIWVVSSRAIERYRAESLGRPGRRRSAA